MRTRTLSLALAAQIVGIPVGLAADQVLTVPTGWELMPYRFAAGTQRSAFILYPTGVNPYHATSKVMIAPITGAVVFRELPGKSYAISSSPSGSHVLVHRDGPDTQRVTLLDGSTGVELWTKAGDERLFRFSATGNCLVAHKEHGESVAGKDIEIFDLAGVRQRRITYDTIVTSAIAADDGRQVVVALGRTVSAVRVGPDGTSAEEWSTNLAPEEEPITHLDVLSADRFLISQELGYFKVVRWNGTVEYTYNPEALDSADPARTFEDYASYDAYPTPLANKLLLFRNSPDALILNLTTGALTSKPIDIAVPAGLTLMDSIKSGRLAFGSPGEIRVRMISY